MSNEKLDNNDLDINQEEENFIVPDDNMRQINELDIEIYEINIRLQEIDSKLEEYDIAYYDLEEEILTEEELKTLKNEYKELKRKLRELNKKKSNKIWDKIPGWIFIYGLLQVILSSALFMPSLTELFIDVSIKILGSTLETKFGAFIVFFGLTIINFLITVIIYLIVYKDKFKRNLFAVVLVLHAIASSTTFIYFWDSFQNIIKEL